ncbi:MAG: hypothetical protein WC565_04775 [Parcubacteria group bacterium]
MRRTITLLSILAMAGCASMGDVVRVRENGSEGVTRVYPVTPEQAWDISKMVFHWEGADEFEEHRDQGYMLTSSGWNLISWGTYMGAWIRPIDANNTEVTVVTKRKASMSLVTKLTEDTYHRRFTHAVGIVKSGHPLPLSRPR